MWSGNFKTAIASLRASKGRSLFTMLGIIIGISSVVTIVSLGEGLKQEIVGQINHLGNNVLTIRSGKIVDRDAGGNISSVNLLAFLNSSSLTNQDITALNNLDSLNAVVPIDFVTSSASSDGRSSNNLFVIGTSSQMSDVLKQKIQYGSDLADDSDSNMVLIGSEVAHQLFGQFNPVGSTIHINKQDFIVGGVLAKTSGGLLSIAETDFNSAVFMPLVQAEHLSGGRTNILQIMVSAKDDGKVDQTAAQVKAALLKTHQHQDDFTVLKHSELVDIASGVVGSFTRFISGIAAISLLVAGIGIMDIMLVNISERTREIGIRKAVGATNRQILRQFLTEGVALSVVGGILGIITSLVIFALLRLYTDLHPVLTIPIMILAVGISVTVGIVFSIAPALKASRKSPIEALRS